MSKATNRMFWHRQRGLCARPEGGLSAYFTPNTALVGDSTAEVPHS